MQQPELCKELLQRILPELEIDHIEYPEAQKGIRPDVDAKNVRLDVYVKDGKGTIYDIEMQVADTKELPKRTRYYQSLIDLQLIDKGQAYKKLKPSYIIFICPFDVFGRGRHIYTFENTCREDQRRHEYMTLLMRDQENIEKGIEQGIWGMVSALKDLGIPDITIVQKIQERLSFCKDKNGVKKPYEL